MGGGYYHEDVSSARQSIGSTRSSSSAFDYNQSAQSGKVDKVHKDLNILRKTRECFDSPDHPASTPIAVLMDVTKSRGDDAKKIYAQVPSMMGSLKVMDLVSDPSILFGAIGDANHDKAPIQVGQFEADRRMDEWLKKIWMEEGGGGTGEESYELMAYYLSHKTDLDSYKKRKAKGFCFFTGDEAPYPSVSPAFVKSYIGDTIKSEISSKKIFKELQKKFHTFLVFPRLSMRERQTAIDAEIKQRLEAAGGRFKDIDIRATLIWNDRNDLDIHCIAPSGEHIFYGNPRGNCKGELDVDRNVHGETTKPVENIRWAMGDARRGTYKFFVQNYRYHESRRGAVPFKVEIEIDGEIQTFEGQTPAGVTGEASNQLIIEFNYVPGEKGKKADYRDDYRDEVILAKWANYIPTHNILRVKDPASTVEVMLGAMALQSGKMDLSQFEASMKERRVKKARRDDVIEALSDFANQAVFDQVDASAFG